VTAYCITNATHGVRLQGYNAQKASFSRRIEVKQIGHALLHLESFNEDHLITLPSLHIEGLISGSPFVELNKSTHIVSSSGYTSRIDYSGRGWLSGKKNSFTASLFPTGHEKDPLYAIEGQWTGEFTIRDVRTKAVVDSWDHKAHKTTPLRVAPLEAQDELETRRAWRRVAEGISRGDMNLVAHEKTLIEQKQRQLRQAEKEAGGEWDRVFFRRATAHPVFAKLAGHVGEGLETDKTNGVWLFDDAKAKQAQKPYRPGTMP